MTEMQERGAQDRPWYQQHVTPVWKGLPKTLTGPVARGASFVPLVGKGLKRAEARDAFFKVLAFWRRRLKDLRGAGWNVLDDEGQYWRCYNCTPAGVITRPVLRPCNRPAACPFCHARVAQEVFRAALREGLRFHPLWRKEHRLIAFRSIIPLRRQRRFELRDRLTQESAWRRQVYRATEASGAYLTSTIVPGKIHRWEVRRCGVLLVSSEVAPEAWEEVLHGRVRDAAVNSGIDVAAITSWALRYPERLFLVDPKAAVACLHARQGLRMAATYGDFRRGLPADKRLSTSKEGEEWHPESSSSAT
jgi:hypothetical protein